MGRRPRPAPPRPPAHHTAQRNGPHIADAPSQPSRRKREQGQRQRRQSIQNALPLSTQPQFPQIEIEEQGRKRLRQPKLKLAAKNSHT